MAIGQQTGLVSGNGVADQPGSFGTTPTPGSLIVVAISGWHSGGFDCQNGDVTDNQGNTYTRAIQSDLGTEGRTSIFYAQNIAASGTFTVTVSPQGTASNYFHFSATEFTGMFTSGALDQVAINSAGLTDTPTSGTTSATTQADEVVVAVLLTNLNNANDGIDVPATTGFTNLSVYQASNTIIGHASDYKIVSSTGTQSAAWGTLLFAGPWTACIATFKVGGAPAATVAQSHFRWRDDNGSETAASWLDSEDASITRALSTNTRLRMQVNTTNDLASSQFQLEYKLSTDATYAKVQVPDATAAAYGAIGADTTTGTTAPTVAYPTGITAGQLLIMVVGNHPDTSTVATPSGWTAPANNTTTGGAGALAADTGPRRITVFTKVADGTETGSVTLGITSGTGAGANIFRCTKSVSKDWAVACAIGSDNSAGTAISVTFGSDPGVIAGDLVFVGFINSADTAAHASEALTQTGMTYGTMTEHKDYAVATGTPDLRVVLTQHAVTSGTSSAAATWVATASGTASGSSAGPAIMIRARAQDQAMLMATSANVAASGETTTAQLTAPAGKSTSDFDAGRLMDDENPADAIDIDADDYTEVEWCIQASAVAAAGTYQFRVTRSGTVLDTYTVTPTWTIGAAAVGQPTMKRGRGIPGMRLGGTTFGQGF